MKFMLGSKGAMTQVYDKNGHARAATIVSAGPVVVTQVKTVEKDGYEAAQFGYGTRKAKNIAKPQLGHFKDFGAFMHQKECRDLTGVTVGDSIDISQFTVGEYVTVSGITKAKGFQGVVKRHNFAGDMKTHGRKHSLRMPGSLGGGGRAGGRVAKGKRMGGRMGGERVTVSNLEILQIHPASNTLVIAGAVPGIKGVLLEITARNK